MTDAITWWLVLEVLGLAAVPMAFVLFRRLPSRGYFYAKTLGLLFVGYVLWLAATTGALPNVRGAIILVMFLMSIAGLIVAGRQRQELASFIKANLPLIAFGEVVFLLLFVIGALLRAYDPGILHTEQPMDFAFLNGILRSGQFPPHDPWLSGHSISYYYFGYLLMAVLVQVTGSLSSVGYNLALVSIFALVGVAVLGLAYDLVRASGGRQRAALGAGLGAVLLVLVVGNLEGFLEMLHAHNVGGADFWRGLAIQGLDHPYVSTAWYPTESWWWWRATRVIGTVVDGRTLDYTITEFPFFSFLLGDLHPHVMALPFAVLALALAFNLLRDPEPLGVSWLVRHPFAVLSIALSLGALGFINSWDLPGYGVVLVAAAAIQIYRRTGQWGRRFWLNVVGFGGGVAVGAVLLYLPFYVGLQTQASGILPVPGGGTKPLHFLIIWGLFLFITVPFILAQSTKGGHPTRTRQILWSFGIPLIPVALWALVELGMGVFGGDILQSLGAIVLKLGQLIPWLIILAGLVFVMGRRLANPEAAAGELFSLLLVGAGLGLTLGTELFFIKDLFGNRMNTVFKFYYQAWMLLALGAAFGLWYLSSRWSPAGWLGWLKRGWVGGVVVLLAMSLVYPVAAAYSKTGGFATSPTWDGLAFLQASRPAEYDALRWLQLNIAGAPVILEAVGDDYSEYGRVAGRTGLPTVLGWPGHEVQWRGSAQAFQGREQDVSLIYRDAELTQARALLEKYHVAYVYVGALEQSKYGSPVARRFDGTLFPVYRNDQVTIYRVAASP